MFNGTIILLVSHHVLSLHFFEQTVMAFNVLLDVNVHSTRVAKRHTADAVKRVTSHLYHLIEWAVVVKLLTHRHESHCGSQCAAPTVELI